MVSTTFWNVGHCESKTYATTMRSWDVPVLKHMYRMVGMSCIAHCLFNLLNLLWIFKLQNCLTSLRLCATKQLDQFWYYKGHKLWELSKSKHRDQESFLFSPHPFHPEGAKICARHWWEHSRMSRMIVFLCLCFCLHSPWRFWCHIGKQKLMQQGKREND